MKNKFTKVIPHVIGWALFLSLPILFSPKTPEFVQLKMGLFLYLPILLSSIALIVIFYFNYFFLIPRYLFNQKYIAYVLYCIGCIALMFSLQRITFITFRPNFIPQNHHSPGMEREIPLFFGNALLMFFITFLISITLRLNNQWRQTEKERLSAQLSYLKTQIQPHFLFNTLNSIYSVTIGKAPQAAEMVLKLSEMMRYTLKETQLDFVPLEKEIEYIANFIDLQKVRFDNSVKLVYNISGDYANKQIAPMLLIPFIENAFKHGVNSEQNSNIKITIDVKGSELDLQVFNNKVDMQNDIDEKSELGIQNTKHRLELIYPSKYILSISETNSDYTVSLHIKLA